MRPPLRRSHPVSANWPAILLAAAVLLFGGARFAASQSAAKKKSVKARSAHEQPAGRTEAPVSLNPIVFLIRDPVVLTELQLTPAEEGRLAEFAAAANEEAWKLRDLVPEAGTGNDAVQKLNDLVESNLARILTAAQSERLKEVVLQVQGPSAFTERKTADRLNLTAAQVEKISRLWAATQADLKDLRGRVSQSTDRPGLYRQAEKVRGDLDRDLLAALTSAQRDRWVAMRGKAVDLTKLQMLTALAPELRDVDAWINSPPLTLAQLRGQVVALHFWTFR